MSEDYPHVTHILKEVGLVDTQWFTDEARDRGTAVHLATQYLDEGDLDFGTLDPQVEPRVRQYQKFLADVQPQIVSIEESVFNRAYRYQGRVDRVIVVDGRTGVLDIKGPFTAPWQALQLKLYALCYEMSPCDRILSMARWNLMLSDDTYKFIDVDEESRQKGRDDHAGAIAAVNLYHWKEKYCA